MNDSTNTSATTSVNTNSKRKTRGITMLTKVTKTHESGVRFQVNFDVRIGKTFGEHADSYRGYMAVQGRSKMNILIDN